MISAMVNRIIAVVGGNDEQIIFAHLFKYFRKARVELFERFSVSA